MYNRHQTCKAKHTRSMGCGASRSTVVLETPAVLRDTLNKTGARGTPHGPNILSENEAATRGEDPRSDLSLSSASTPSVCSRPHVPSSSNSLPIIVLSQPEAHGLAAAQHSSPSTTASQAETIPLITEQGPQEGMSEYHDIADGCTHSVAHRRSVQPVGEDILRAFFECHFDGKEDHPQTCRETSPSHEIKEEGSPTPKPLTPNLTYSRGNPKPLYDSDLFSWKCNANEGLPRCLAFRLSQNLAASSETFDLYSGFQIDTNDLRALAAADARLGEIQMLLRSPVPQRTYVNRRSEQPVCEEILY